MLNKFSVEYLNKLYAMNDQITKFQERKEVVEERKQKLQTRLENELR